MLLRGITQGHPFTDGNKRTGWLLASYFLEVMGYPRPIPLPVEGIVDFCLQVSAGTIRDTGVMAARIKALWRLPLAG
jgi:death-on-curing protein